MTPLEPMISKRSAGERGGGAFQERVPHSQEGDTKERDLLLLTLDVGWVWMGSLELLHPFCFWAVMQPKSRRGQSKEDLRRLDSMCV